ncbi:Nn.00g027470.m01.CDS01 [Neocucurbitaria sp. VM-36]
MSCPECFKGSAHTHLGESSGQELTVHGIQCYVALPPSPTASQSTIIFLPDAFGLHFINNQILADKYTRETGFRVLIPDVINGGACSQSVLLHSDTFMDPVTWWDIAGQLKRAVALVKMAAIFIPFLIRGSPYKTYPKMLDFARNVKADLPSGAKLGLCGFCWGGLPSTLLCAEPLTPGSQERLVDAHFTAHPSRVDTPKMIVDAIEKFKVPYSLANGENDFVLTHKQVERTEVALRERVGRGDGENGYWFEFVNYKGCGHGFAVRGKPGDKVAEKGAEEACNQAVSWFKRWL